jgi:glucokinase
MAETAGKQECFVGIDLGGTKILAGVFSPKLKCLGKTKMSTKAQRGPEAVIQRIAKCLRDAVDECDLELKNVKGVGIGAPGAVDPETGNVIFAPNLGWHDIPLKKELENLLDLPVFVENDGNICALGVYEAELKSKPSHMAGVFIGTGIGGGLILNGQLHSGHNRTAGEIGHMVLEVGGPKCSCGNRGCFEALASRLAIFHRIQSAVKDGQKTILADILRDDLTDLRSGDLRKAVRRKDKFVERIIEQAAEHIGIAVANLINLINPDVIVLGGGVINALEDEMMPIIIKKAKEHALSGTSKGIEIIASQLGDNAGIVGGAVLARTRTK